VTRGASCQTLAQVADDGHGWPLVCLDSDHGRVWSIAGIDAPFTATATEHASCAHEHVGALAIAADGMALVCKKDGSPDPAAQP